MVWTLLGSVVPSTPAQPVNVQFCAPQFGHLVLPHLCWFGATQHSHGVACLVLAEMGCVWSSRASFSRPLSRCSISWSSIRSWGLSSGAANSVALGATVSPACFQDRRPDLSRCVWGCGHLGTWEHVAWLCQKRPSSLRRPRSAWLSRFGWSMDSDCPTEVAEVQAWPAAWLCQCQLEIWNVRYRSE